MFSIFPFSIKFQKQISQSIELSELLPIVKASIDGERTGKTNKDPIIIDGKVVFKNSIFTRNSFHAIERGFFTILSNDGITAISYRFFMYWYFGIALIIGNVVALFTDSIFSKSYFYFYLYLLFIWVGSLVSQKLRLNDIAKSIERSINT
jgi:hypothetical protein